MGSSQAARHGRGCRLKFVIIIYSSKMYRSFLADVLIKLDLSRNEDQPGRGPCPVGSSFFLLLGEAQEILGAFKPEASP